MDLRIVMVMLGLMAVHLVDTGRLQHSQGQRNVREVSVKEDSAVDISAGSSIKPNSQSCVCKCEFPPFPDQIEKLSKCQADLDYLQKYTQNFVDTEIAKQKPVLNADAITSIIFYCTFFGVAGLLGLAAIFRAKKL